MNRIEVKVGGHLTSRLMTTFRVRKTSQKYYALMYAI